MDYTISLQALFWLSAGIASLYGLYKLFNRPFNQIDDHERRIKKIEKSIDDSKETDKLILTALNAQINHMIDGKGIDQLIKVRDDLQKGIISHHSNTGG